DNAGVWPIECRHDAAVTDIGIGEAEARLPVIVLLRHHAVEPDHAGARMRDRLLPDAQTVAAPAQIGPYDVEAEEGEAGVIVDARDGRGRLAVELADEEAVRIDRGETGGVGQSRVPGFGCGPIDRDGDFVRPHRPDAQVSHGSNPAANSPPLPRKRESNGLMAAV